MRLEALGAAAARGLSAVALSSLLLSSVPALGPVQPALADGDVRRPLLALVPRYFYPIRN